MTESKKRTLLILTIILSALPSVFLVKYPSVVTAKTIALYVSGIAGYLGIVTLLWSYMLGAKSVFGTLFRDLAPVLTIHKWLGKYGTLAIFLHPLLVMYSYYGFKLTYLITPQIGSEFDRHVTLGRIAFFVCLLIWITSALIRDRIKFRSWRYIHLLGYIALPFAFLHVPDVGSNFMTSLLTKAYFVLLVAAFLIFSLLRARGFFNLDAMRYEIVAHRQLVSDDPEIYLIQLRPTSYERIVPQKGQYIYLKFAEILSESHPFSVLDYDRETGDISVAYRTFGRFTKQLKEQTVGDTMLLTGPYGDFTADIEEHHTEPAVFIAGGIGVTPMMRHLIEDTEREQWLFYANRTAKSAMITPELRTLLGDRLVTIFSREQAKVGDEQGRFSAAMVQKRLAEPARYHYYICGSDDMMQHCKTELQKLGVASSHIRCEAFAW